VRRVIGDDHRARLFGHLGARLRDVSPLLLRDDGVVAELLQVLQLLGPSLGGGTQVFAS
jgi:hypothetical protein